MAGRRLVPVCIAITLAAVTAAAPACSGESAPATDRKAEVFAFDAKRAGLKDASPALSSPASPEALRPVPEMEIINVDFEAATIEFKSFRIADWYRRPLLLKQGDAEFLFCFDSPFFSSINDRRAELDAVFWYPYIESQFGLPAAETAAVIFKVDFVKKESAPVMKRMFGR